MASPPDGKVDIDLQPGTYFAGISRPWYAPRSVVESYLEGKGFKDIAIFSRDQPAPLTAFGPVNPRVDPYYNDDWDEWLVATYPGPAIRMPQTKKVWAWLSRARGAVPVASAPKARDGALVPTATAALNPRPETLPAAKVLAGGALIGFAIDLAVVALLAKAYTARQKRRRAA